METNEMERVRKSRVTMLRLSIGLIIITAPLALLSFMQVGADLQTAYEEWRRAEACKSVVQCEANGVDEARCREMFPRCDEGVE